MHTHACYCGPATPLSVCAGRLVIPMESIPTSSASPSGGPLRALASLSAFVGLFVGLPVLWAVWGIPLALTRPVELVFGIACAGVGASIISPGAAHWSRSAFRRWFVGFTVVVALVFGGYWGLETVFATLRRFPSPSGRIVAVVRDVDEGALGGGSQVFLCGRLIPGVVNWDYPITLEDYIDEVVWAGPSTLVVAGKSYRVPRAMQQLSW